MEGILTVEMVYRVLGAALVRVGVEGIRGGRSFTLGRPGLGWWGDYEERGAPPVRSMPQPTSF